jgi:hypothetical protein
MTDYTCKMNNYFVCKALAAAFCWLVKHCYSLVAAATHSHPLTHALGAGFPDNQCCAEKVALM